METRYSVLIVALMSPLISIAGHAATNLEAVQGFEKLSKDLQDRLLFSCARCEIMESAEGISLDAEERKFLTLINDYRAKNGLGPLQISIKLTRAAEWMSEDMAAKNYLEHIDSNGRSPIYRSALQGYTDNPQAENILVGSDTAEKAFEQWRTSPGHNANMLHPRVKVIGIARAKNLNTKEWAQYGWWWTTNFGGWAYPDDVVKSQ